MEDNGRALLFVSSKTKATPYIIPHFGHFSSLGGSKTYCTEYYPAFMQRPLGRILLEKRGYSILLRVQQVQYLLQKIGMYS